ncbi:MAG: indolepyruvate oxidoreductase subunit beta [Thermoleophilia bacterium]|jgi:indolepyruvate ferredoxin oxidoreductase beta subunit
MTTPQVGPQTATGPAIGLATFNMLLSGVGGQGVVLASYVLSQVAMAEGYDVKQSEVHGMSQRGGSVTSHFRFGEKVWAPLVTPGTADVLLAFEALEALRYIHWLRPKGLLVYSTLQINPSPVSAGLAEYPSDIDTRIATVWPRVHSVDANRLAQQAGTVKAANVVMLGAVSGALPFAARTWEAVIRRAVPPKTVDVNLEAFRLGKEAASVE